MSAALEGQAAASAETVRQLAASRDQLSAALSASAADVQSLQDQLAQLAESAAKERAEAAAAVANLQKVFAEKEIERASAFAQELSTAQATFSKAQSDATAAASAKLADLDSQRDRAAQIVQVVGNIGVTGNFQRIANEEGSQANIWRWITIGVFAAGIGLAVATFAKFWDQPLTTENLWSVIVRLLYALAITAPAWYTARESARHRTNADRARQTELELASIGPFIELMPDDKKIAIKEALTKAYFGRQVDAHHVQTPLDALQLKDFVVELAKVLKK